MFASLLNFDKFVAPTLIRIVYWIGIVLIALGTLGAIFGGGMMGAMMGGYGGGGGFNVGGALIGLIAGAAGFLMWRVACEVWIVIFSINDRLGVLVDRGKM
ncbi:MAG TPA: DUF4282 domain-containing protein [Caulobacterales bacterium]|nr:DUF4282 domain-containing protein [Caulobacterales bacterium]